MAKRLRTVLLALALVVPVGVIGYGLTTSAAGGTAANRPTLDDVANQAKRIAGAYYTGLTVGPTNTVTVYLAHAPQAVLDRLNTAHPGAYVIHNNAPRPWSAVMKVMRALWVDPLKGKITLIAPTQDGYLRVGVRSDVATAQAQLDARYGPGIIRVSEFRGPFPIGVAGRTGRRVSAG